MDLWVLLWTDGRTKGHTSTLSPYAQFARKQVVIVLWHEKNCDGAEKMLILRGGDIIPNWNRLGC